MKNENPFDSLTKFLINLVKEEVEHQLTIERNRKPEKVYYSIREVAEITGLTVNALKGRRKRGTLSFINEGNSILMHKNELERFLNKLQ